MRARPFLALALLAAAPLPAAAQTPIQQPIGTPVTNVPKITAQIGILKDTVIISSFSLNDGASSLGNGQITLTHKLIGYLAPAFYRASKFADFHDAAWVRYPSGGLIVVPNPGAANSTNCNGGLPVILYFQVRGVIPIGGGEGVRFVESQVVHDDICWFFG